MLLLQLETFPGLTLFGSSLPENGETSNKINVVTGNSIRKTHCTISHTILRQNSQDSYLLHRSPKSLGMRYNNIAKIDASSPLHKEAPWERKGSEIKLDSNIPPVNGEN